MEEFRIDNTEGYTQKELDALNKEWAARVEERGIGEATYHLELSWFQDEVSRR